MILTPKGKAAYFVVKYMSKVVNKQIAKECALVAIDEIIDALEKSVSENYNYWQEVKQEIKKA